MLFYPLQYRRARLKIDVTTQVFRIQESRIQNEWGIGKANHRFRTLGMIALNGRQQAQIDELFAIPPSPQLFLPVLSFWLLSADF
jgi:hypothetical protein